jgi:sulfite exporter TauE/SafE/plastocyanin domain-containing protein/copper chaperone CopZ
MSHTTSQKIIVPIKGMHCRSCEILLEEHLSQIKHVERVEVNYRKGYAEVYYYEHEPRLRDLEEAVRVAGYQIGEAEKKTLFSGNPADYREFLYSVTIVAIGYFLLKVFGITDLINTSVGGGKFGFATALTVGLVAGFSSCMALVGGLVLGLSAKHAEARPEATTTQKFRPHLYFNLGRIGGYVVLGGLLGSLGSVFQLSPSLMGFLTLVAGAVMLFVGLQLVDIFPRLSAIKLTLPKGISKLFGLNKHNSEYNHKNAIVVGALTFFLPCGFTQAMQVYAVSTGSFMSGAIIMGLFALGTAPGLLSIGGLTSALKSTAARKFFKTAGVVVIIFALFNISNSLTLAGIRIGSDAKISNVAGADSNIELVDGVQIVRMEENFSGYSPNVFTVKKGVPVKWIIDAKAPYSCASSIISQGLGIRKNLLEGINTIEFTPNQIGNIPFSCSMGMYTGSFNVTDGDDTILLPNTPTQTLPPQGTGSCGGSGGGIKQQKDSVDTAATVTNGTQVLNTTYTATGLQPNSFRVKAGTSVKLNIDVQATGRGCGYAIMIPDLYNNVVPLVAGKPITMEFTPTTPGTYSITCSMEMIRFGTITVE